MAEQTLSKAMQGPLRTRVNVCSSFNLGRTMSSKRDSPEAFVFETAMGYMALVAQGDLLCQLNFAHPTAAAAINALAPEYRANVVNEPPMPTLVERLKSFAAGEHDDFRDIKLDLRHLSAFQRKVIERLRRVPYGKTVGYGELAAMAGSPGAARAVGNTMAGNRFPVVVPCHRVINSNGSLGSYSGPNGILTKDQLLKLEGCQLKPSNRKRKSRAVKRSFARR